MARTYLPNEEPVPGFRLIEFLGRGGFGEVWKASAPGGTQVALKMIDITDRQGQKELGALRMVKRIRHPNLTPITAFWLRDEKGVVFDEGDAVAAGAASAEEATAFFEARQPVEMILAMGLGDKNLLDRLKECRKQGMAGIPPDELLDYLEDAAKAIDHLNASLHDLGNGPVAIQHCDIKPQNIMIVSGSAQVCDFGLARAMGDVRASVAAGSPAYAAPECIQDNTPSPATDQYSLAISYVELRTGRLPFEEVSFMAVLKAHMLGELDLSLLPDAERAVIQKGTHRDPTRRYPSNLTLVRDLRKAVHGELKPQDVNLGGPAAVAQSWGSLAAPAKDTASLAEAATQMWDTSAVHEQATQPALSIGAPAIAAGAAVADAAADEATPDLGASLLAPRKPPVLLYAFGGLAVLLAGAAPFLLVSLRTGSFELALPGTVEVRAGQQRDVFIGLTREGFAGPVELGVDEVPRSLAVHPARVTADERGGQVSIQARLDAAAGEFELPLTASGGGLKKAGTLRVKIVPAQGWLPPGYAPAPGAKVVAVQQTPYFDKLVHSATGAVFLLISKARREDPEPFYIMQDKATNALFAAFAQAQPEKLAKDTQWRLGAIAGGKDLGDMDPKLPAFRMTVGEAHAACAWLGGRLPSCPQWDKAAGLFDRDAKLPADQTGPFAGPTDGAPARIAVNLAASGPLAAGTAQHDVSPAGCRDMAGNGAEWTRDIPGVERRSVPLAQPTEDDFVLLRGRSYQHPRPLTYADLLQTDSSQTQTQPYGQALPDVGFRAVLELPAQ